VRASGFHSPTIGSTRPGRNGLGQDKGRRPREEDHRPRYTSQGRCNGLIGENQSTISRFEKYRISANPKTSVSAWIMISPCFESSFSPSHVTRPETLFGSHIWSRGSTEREASVLKEHRGSNQVHKKRSGRGADHSYSWRESCHEGARRFLR